MYIFDLGKQKLLLVHYYWWIWGFLNTGNKDKWYPCCMKFYHNPMKIDLFLLLAIGPQLNEYFPIFQLCKYYIIFSLWYFRNFKNSIAKLYPVKFLSMVAFYQQQQPKIHGKRRTWITKKIPRLLSYTLLQNYSKMSHRKVTTFVW